MFSHGAEHGKHLQSCLAQDHYIKGGKIKIVRILSVSFGFSYAIPVNNFSVMLGVSHWFPGIYQ